MRDQESASEVTPLLVNSEAVAVGTRHDGEDVSHLDPSNPDPASKVQSTDDVIPKAQIFFLCCVRLIDPIAFFGIFPFVNQMIFDTREVPEEDVGFYSGLIESVFSIVAMIFTIPWGRLADRIGRKPVLVISIVGLAICTALFGMSTTIWHMFLTRCSAGMFAGSIVTIRTMMAENATPTTQGQIFSYFAFAGNLGIFLGPLIGGALAKPATQYGGIFKHNDFFRAYPYALATFVIGILGLLSALLVLVYVKETLNTRTSGKGGDGDASQPPMTLMELLKSPGVAMVLLLTCHINILAFSYTAVLPVFYFTSIKKGGFGLSPIKISLFMGLGGLGQALWLLVVFPRIQRRWSTGAVFRLCARAYPIFFCVPPLYSYVLRQGWTTFFWATGPALMMLGVGVAMCFTAIQLALNDVNPRPSTLGTLNSVALAMTSGIRSFSPALFTSIFAVGVRKQILGGYLVWVIMIAIAAGFAVDAQLLPPNAEGKTERKRPISGDEDA